MTSRTAPVRRDALRLVIVGHVDHGKSTLVGRLFHDTDSLPPGKAEAIRRMCERRGMPFEWAFLMDALQAERDQGVTIDTSQIWLRTRERDVVIIDAPGHKEFLKNMVTGAAVADAALLVVDADEGIKEQSRRHGYLLHLLGVTQIAVVINKMDLVGHDEGRFRELSETLQLYLAKAGVRPAFVIPISARDGDNLVVRSHATPWYAGPTLVAALEAFQPAPPATDLPLRFPVQDVYKFDNRRIIVGRIESGVLETGATLLFSPVNKSARVASIERWPPGADAGAARAGEAIGITLDEPLFIERGALGSHRERPPVETFVFRAKLFWLGHRPLTVGSTYRLKLHTSEAAVTVQSIEKVIDSEDLSAVHAERVEQNAVAEVTLRSRSLLALDPHAVVPRTGRFVLVDGHDIAGGGIISMEGYPDQRHLTAVRATNVQRVAHRVTTEDRAGRNGHRPGVLWFTGLSGSGKSTLAIEAEKVLFSQGYQVCALDGDNLRFGLNADLGFTPVDRAENIRRAGEVAGLLARAGFLVIAAFISPYREDRARARQAGGEAFHEVYVRAPLHVCERRDPKGLYRRARLGEISEFTGVSAPYEPPENPELVVDTEHADIDACVARIVEYAHRTFGAVS